MTEKKCGQCDAFAQSARSAPYGACTVRTAGIDWYIRRHVGSKACPAFRERKE